MYRHIFLNPFYWYAVIWSFVLILFQFQWTTLYVELNWLILMFFLITIVLSLVLGYFFAKLIKKTEVIPHNFSKKWGTIMIIIIAIGFLLEFAYEGHIPLIDELTNSSYTYMDFGGIPTFHVFLVTFTEFAAVYFYYCHCYENDKKIRRTFLLYTLIAFVWIATLYNRATLIMIIFMCMLIRLSMLKKIEIWYIIAVIALGVFVLWAFGIFGNIRSGSRWNDSSYIIEVAHIDLNKYPSFLPKEFIWAYVYLVSPLGNLNDQVLNVAPNIRLDGILYYILPDALSKRIFPTVDTSFQLTQPLLTVCTGFAGVYKYGGIIGMFLMYFALSAEAYIVAHITAKRSSSFIVSNAIVCCMTFLMFFDNIFNFTGFTFSLFYAVALVVFEGKRKIKRGLDRNLLY